MTEYKTMRVPEEAWEAAKAYKEKHELTWDEYMRLPVEGGSTTKREPDLSQLTEKLDEINRGVREATEAAQSAERSVEQLQ